jgi:hypothetical protein
MTEIVFPAKQEHHHPPMVIHEEKKCAGPLVYCTGLKYRTPGRSEGNKNSACINEIFNLS